MPFKSISRQSAIRIASISCGCLVISLGITCLVLGLMGFFAYEDLCVSVQSFEVQNFDLGSSATAYAAQNNNSLLGVLDEVTGGLGSALNLTSVNMTVELTLEVTNSNPYDIRYAHTDDGTVVIPATTDGAAQNTDLLIGQWNLQSSTLKKNARNQLTVTLTAAIDLLDIQNSSTNVSSTVSNGGPLDFRIAGGIEGSTWVPRLKGETSFVCFARLGNILSASLGNILSPSLAEASLGEDVSIRCKTTTRVGNLRTENEEKSFDMDEQHHEEEEEEEYDSCAAMLDR